MAKATRVTALSTSTKPARREWESVAKCRAVRGSAIAIPVIPFHSYPPSLSNPRIHAPVNIYLSRCYNDVQYLLHALCADALCTQATEGSLRVNKGLVGTWLGRSDCWTCCSFDWLFGTLDFDFDHLAPPHQPGMVNTHKLWDSKTFSTNSQSTVESSCHWNKVNIARIANAVQCHS